MIRTAQGNIREKMRGKEMKKEKINIRPYTRQFYRGNGWRFALGVGQTILNAGCNLMIAWLIQQVIDLMSGVDSPFTLGQLGGLVLAAMALLGITYACAYWSTPRFISRAIGQYKNFVFERLTQKGIAAFSSESTSLYISALSNDAAAIETDYLNNLFGMVNGIFLFVAALFMMFWYNPVLTFVSIGISFLPILVSVLTSGRAVTAEKRVSEVNGQYMSSLQDSLMGFSVIKSFRAEKQMARMFQEKVKEVSEAKEVRRKISILIQMLSALSGILVQLGVFLVGAYLALSGKGVTAGTVLVFVQLLNYILQPISTIPGYLAGYRSARGLIQKLAKALDENVQDPGTRRKTELKDGIAVQHLWFSYEQDKPILKDLNCTFDAGKSYAIVGASGSGKSTLLHMLTASYHGYTGSIAYDDVELRDIRSDALYDMLSVIQQNVFIFNASIRDNITMFSEFSDDEVRRAIRLSGLSRLIEEKGEGYLCGENGVNLSGGEKQRISIARSLLRKAQILLADEVTAALDAETSYQVSDAILNLEDLTRIVVTHNLDGSLLQRYDRILTMKSGEIVESGTFEELMDRKGYFYSLYTVSQ